MIVIDHNNTSNTIVDKAMHLTLLLTKGLQLAANLQYAKRETDANYTPQFKKTKEWKENTDVAYNEYNWKLEESVQRYKTKL